MRVKNPTVFSMPVSSSIYSCSYTDIKAYSATLLYNAGRAAAGAPNWALSCSAVVPGAARSYYSVSMPFTFIISTSNRLGGDGMLTSDPASLARISFSISAICCSSANASAHGTPSSSALVLSTNSAFPPNPRVEVT